MPRVAARRSRQPRLPHPDDLVGRRHRRDRRRTSRPAFPSIQGPRSEDICYATTNRQAAVKAIARECDRMLVIGAPNSSNSLRLAEVAERKGVEARLIQRADDIDWDWLGQPRPSASPPVLRRPKCWSAKSSMRCASGSTSRGRSRPHAEAHDFQASAGAGRLTSASCPSSRFSPMAPAAAIPGPAAGGTVCAPGPRSAS